MTRVRLMGIVNLNSDSFSDDGRVRTGSEHRDRARALVEAGADVLDIGAQSATTDTPVTPVHEETAAITGLIEGLDAPVELSVDTYKTAVAVAALDAGADIINDYSGGIEPDLVDAVAGAGGRYVLTHNEGAPKQRLTDPRRYQDVVARVAAFFHAGLTDLQRRGLPPSSVILDPGIDLSKTPAQTVDVLRRIGEVSREFPRSELLIALSRKDFIGAITSRRPADRDPGTLAAVAWATGQLADHGAPVLLRLHDVGAAADFLGVLEALRGTRHVDAELSLDPSLFRNRTGAPSA